MGHHGPADKPSRPPHRGDCPFCAGNEHLAPLEICRAEAADGIWNVRVIPNKFSAFIVTEDMQRRKQGAFRSMTAAGHHEIVVEHQRHDLTTSDMEQAHLADILRIYRERYQVLRKHPHPQITAAPVISSLVCMRLQEARRHHERNGVCLFCQVLQEELEAGERIIKAGPSFVAFVPYASLSPYHMWIFPRQHASSYDEISDTDIDALAGVLGRQLRRLKLAAADPDYNFTIRSAPLDEAESCCFHWCLTIVPRVNRLAGFELVSGSYINSQRPERSAEMLRSVIL